MDLLVHTVLKRYDTTGSKTGTESENFQKPETGTESENFHFRFPVSEPAELHIVRTVLTSKSILVFIKSALKLMV